jgi:hypothetical protein
MTLAQTYSWIFYAIGLASQNVPAGLVDIEAIADGINHAIPTQKEMQKSISWCVSQGFVLKEGKKYKLTIEGSAVLNGSSSNTTFVVWKYIENQFSKIGVDNTRQTNPKTMNTEPVAKADRGPLGRSG